MSVGASTSTTRDDFVTSLKFETRDLFTEQYVVDERSSERARRIRIEIHSPTEVRLVIPRRASRREAREFLASRQDWVLQKLAELRLRHAATPLDRQRLNWDGRDELPLRGQARRLLLVPVSGARACQVRIETQTITLFAPSARLADRALLRRALVEALRHEALLDARRLLDLEAARLGVAYQGPRLADQKTLWGSCTPQGLISLSWRLVMAPPEVLRYVVIHELCHRLRPDHSAAFWALVTRQMPDYAPHYRWLRDHGAGLHAVLPAARA